MKPSTVAFFTQVVFILLGTVPAFSQFNIQVTVNSGAASTTCTDPLGLPPNTNWAVNIENTGWRVYPAFGPCYTALPNLQYDESFLCVADVPATIEVCFRAFDNDANIFSPCNEVMSCMEEICVDLPVPPQGNQNLDVELPDNLASDGSVNLTITTAGIPGGINDEICDAIDIGVLDSGTSVGDDTQSTFNNFCGSYSPGEPDPYAFGAAWVNNVGVWYKFTTTGNPGTHIKVRATSDPSNLGDPVQLQVAIFKSSDNTCTGTFSFVKQNFDFSNWDETIVFTCPEPNTTYFVLVDAVSGTPEALHGYYGIKITELGVAAAAEYRCDAEYLGSVPMGGEVMAGGLRTNACTNNPQPASASAFTVQRAVWFSFTPPPTGHVFIRATSDLEDDPIGIQLAAYESSDNTCTGALSEVGSIYTSADMDETLELHCLDPDKTYFIMLDGTSGANLDGIFSLAVSDAGDETPVTNQTIVLCAGETLDVGNITYSVSGIYNDTLQLPSGCDSIVNTNLTVLPPLNLNFQVVQQGVWLGNTDGEAQVAPTGGAGGYVIEWSDGQSTGLATGLVGGDNYCVTITDLNGCEVDTCFDMPYYVHFIPDYQSSTLNCFGDTDGNISLTAVGGIPPYEFTWSNALGTISGSGTVTVDGEIIEIDDLPAGTYNFQMHDIIFDTAFSVEILQPAELQVSNADVVDVSCYNACDGQINLTVQGGIAPYQYAWSNGQTTSDLQNLCNGGYQLTVIDANGCTAVFDYEVTQPAEFIATAIQVQEVSCFEGSDGQASVNSNGSPMAYTWSNGSTSQSITNLSGGNYEVTVTNLDGCTTVSSIDIDTPLEPVGVTVAVENPIACNGDDNGSLMANVSGPGSSFSYNWNNGQTNAIANAIPAGTYAVTVTNDKGCEATASFTLDEPSPILVETSTNQLTCLTALDDGVITIESISGGVPPYLFSSSGVSFDSIPQLKGYTAGNQVFYVKDGVGCLREFSATIDGPGELLVELDEDQVIELGETIDLDVFVNQPNVTYQWSPSELVSCADCPDPTALPVENTLFTVTVTDDYGCTASADIYLEVFKKRKVFVPNAFTPDGDGINDQFVPFGGNDVRIIKEFKVFDRQGNLVYSANNFPPSALGLGWDGSFNGHPMKPAVFVWFASIEFIDNETQIFKGDVALIK